MACLATVALADSAPDSLPPLPPARVRAWQTGVLRPDRLQHATLSCALAAGIGLACRDARAGAAGAFALGVLKEYWDARRDTFDPADLAADAIGATLGASVAVAGRR